ncbi:type IV toxin-antitoxin system AbiEi family antitoxin domain-containing protein [Nocardia sp. CA2R105]|uniref:type IV toxin-antitoxin system AbiEi family antitoxin domain-containing protein n=1 Tax=Nocardia coffeae TaxID=2873381 RepID=UPI001CA7B1FD|nr:type IV toxin-antitoxin system AbiEi family antitoxin domain-containing protein [Nocardia coffeae]MBY8857777.1 type IV toxin-antitoxin system AbiEi family antitoxin domain-containing protein [Nocardia coffeae]
MGTPQPISRRDALATGLSDSDLRRLCRHGLWHRVRTGHYLSAPAETLSAVDRHRALIRATITATTDAAVVSHVSALVGHDLPTWRIRLDRAHLTRARRNGARVGRLLVVHAGQLAADEVVAVAGIRYTTAARTILDIARTEGFEQAVAAGDAALHRGATTATQLREQLHRARARPGYRQAAQVLTFLDGRSSGVGESRLRVAMAAAGLPAPEVKARILSPDNSFVARVDCLFPELGVAADFDPRPEIDPDPGHPEAAERAAFAAELRDDRLRALGWIPARWTWDELDDPAEAARRITTAAEVAARLTRHGRWVPAPRLR